MKTDQLSADQILNLCQMLKINKRQQSFVLKKIKWCAVKFKFPISNLCEQITQFWEGFYLELAAWVVVLGLYNQV